MGVPSFCGVNFSLSSAVAPQTRGAIIGAGHSLGSPHDGSENGPLFIRTLSKAHTWWASSPSVHLIGSTRGLFDGIVDLGDVQFVDGELTRATELLENLVASLPDETAPCVIGGDHTVTYAVVRGLQRRRSQSFFVVQFDNHLDVQLWRPSGGNAGGDLDSLFHTNVMSHVSRLVGSEHVVQIGASPYVTVERRDSARLPELLAGAGRQIPLTSDYMNDLREFSAGFGRGNDVYITVDVDVLSSGEMSSTGYPSEIGLTVRELLQSIDLVLSENRLIGFDLVEFAAGREDRDAKVLADAARAKGIFLHLISKLD